MSQSHLSYPRSAIAAALASDELHARELLQALVDLATHAARAFGGGRRLAGRREEAARARFLTYDVAWGEQFNFRKSALRAAKGAQFACDHLLSIIPERFPGDEVSGMHNWPQLGFGRMAVAAGPMMAASDLVKIEIEGVGAVDFGSILTASERCSRLLCA